MPPTHYLFSAFEISLSQYSFMEPSADPSVGPPEEGRGELFQVGRVGETFPRR